MIKLGALHFYYCNFWHFSYQIISLSPFCWKLFHFHANFDCLFYYYYYLRLVHQPANYYLNWHCYFIFSTIFFYPHLLIYYLNFHFIYLIFAIIDPAHHLILQYYFFPILFCRSAQLFLICFEDYFMLNLNLKTHLSYRYCLVNCYHQFMCIF